MGKDRDRSFEREDEGRERSYNREEGSRERSSDREDEGKRIFYRDEGGRGGSYDRGSERSYDREDKGEHKESYVDTSSRSSTGLDKYTDTTCVSRQSAYSDRTISRQEVSTPCKELDQGFDETRPENGPDFANYHAPDRGDNDYCDQEADKLSDDETGTVLSFSMNDSSRSQSSLSRSKSHYLDDLPDDLNTASASPLPQLHNKINPSQADVDAVQATQSQHQGASSGRKQHDSEDRSNSDRNSGNNREKGNDETAGNDDSDDGEDEQRDRSRDRSHDPSDEQNDDSKNNDDDDTSESSNTSLNENKKGVVSEKLEDNQNDINDKSSATKYGNEYYELILDANDEDLLDFEAPSFEGDNLEEVATTSVKKKKSEPTPVKDAPPPAP